MRKSLLWTLVLLVASVAWMALTGSSPTPNAAPSYSGTAAALSIDGIHLGMSKGEVRQRLGSPEGATQAHAASTPCVWHKQETTVTFDNDDHVSYVARTVQMDVPESLDSLSLLDGHLALSEMPLTSDASIAASLGPHSRQTLTPHNLGFVDTIWDMGDVHLCIAHRHYPALRGKHEVSVALGYRPPLPVSQSPLWNDEPWSEI